MQRSNGLCTLDRRQFGIGALGLILASRAQAETPTAAALMAASHEATRFVSARFAATLMIQSRSGAVQKRELTGMTKLVDGGVSSARLLRFSSPGDMRGVATLTVERREKGDDLWLYLPAFRRVRRLVSANRADPWVGSDFSLGDVTGHKPGDWRHSLAGAETLGSAECWRIDSVPGTRGTATDTGYSRRTSWIRKSDAALVRCNFFDLSGALFKSHAAEDLRLLDPARRKVQPMRVTMRNMRSGSVSTMAFSSFRANTAVGDAELAPNALGG